MSESVVVELCQSNSIGNRFSPCRVVEERVVTRDEAAELIGKEITNGFFWREQPEDRTGN